MHIIIIGGGKVGAHLASRLYRGHDVTIIEQRSARVEILRGRLPEVDVIQGDACEPSVLESTGIKDVDLVVAVTGDDEDNLVVAALVKEFRSEALVYARVNHPENEWLFDTAWGVDAAISTSSILFEVISRDLGLQDLVTLLNLQADGVEIDEYCVPASAAKAGSALADVALPANVTVMAVLTGGGVRAARGETVLSGGDRLLLLAEGALDARAIRTALGVPEPAECTEETAGH
ncbi:MAG TPA: NAD-binding protein [Coriobacteriia bacterium]|nr:NAD-binding protein [Coriobacteriia bacterium]